MSAQAKWIDAVIPTAIEDMTSCASQRKDVLRLLSLKDRAVTLPWVVNEQTARLARPFAGSEE